MQLFKKKIFKEYTDSELVTEYKKSENRNVMAEIFNRYNHLVYGVCLKYLSNRQLAQDAVLEIFEKLISDLNRHEINNFSSWLYSVSRNHCLMYLRNKKREIPLQENSNSNMWVVQDDDEMENIKIMDIHLKLLEDALVDLNEPQRQCIDLFYLKSKCYKEIEDITGYSAKQVKTYIQNGKRNLKQKIIRNKEVAV